MVNPFFSKLHTAMWLAVLVFGLNLLPAPPATSSLLWPRLPSALAAGNDWPQTFILLAGPHAGALDQIQAIITAGGGQVSHIFPDQALIARVPGQTAAALAALPNVALVTTGPVDMSAVEMYGPQARRLAGVWNSLLAPPASQPVDLLAAEHPEAHNDAFVAPDQPQGGDLAAADTSVTPGYYQTSEFMAGSVAVGIVLVESNGAVDPSTEDWTADEKQQVFNEIVAALNWWAQAEPRANLTFVYDDHFTNPLPTGVEPITRPYYHQQYWINDAMGALGYNASSYFTRVRDYNNNLRAAYHTDWAFTIFVVDSSADSDNRFSDGYFAYAYLGGPFMVMTYGNNGYGPSNMDAVAAHEVGHIFYALDQYYNAYQPCTRRSGYLYIENQNSQYGVCASNVNSIMRGLIYPYTIGAIDTYAAGQIGWRDSDGDNILDPLDTELPLSVDTFIQAGDTITVTGTTNIIPFPSSFPYHPSVTINTLTGVQYRFDGGNWQQATPVDGQFNSTSESFRFTATSLPPGPHILEMAAVDSAGNMSVAVYDPVDGGLNTEFRTPAGAISSQQSLTVDGVAYHLQGGVVARVEYRLNGGPWQQATALDGAFDSDYEAFSIQLDRLEPGRYLIEAFATDGTGKAETNMASQEIEVNATQTVYLPFIVTGM